MATYSEGLLVENTLNNLIRLGKAGKVKHQPFPSNRSELVRVCQRHARKDLTLAQPWLPLEQEEWVISDVWDRVLHTDITINRSGWVVAIDWTLKPSDVEFKTKKLKRVSTALSRLGVDRAIVVLIHQCDDSTNQWVAQLDAIIKEVTQGDAFISDAEIYF